VIRRILLIAALMAMAMLVIGTPAFAADPSQGTIKGQIVNGTTGILPDQPLDVTLITYFNGQSQDTVTSPAGDNGTFSFSGLDTSANYTYEADVTYKDVTFTSDLVSFEEGATEASGQVNVYETTQDLSVLTVAVSHMIVYTSDPALTVREVYSLTNTSSLAFTGFLSFGLPADATPTDMAASLVWTTTNGGNAVVDTVPIVPGQRQEDYTYTMPAGATYTLSRHVPLPMNAFNLLIENGTYTVTSSQLTRTDPLTITGVSYDYYTGGPLQANQPLDIVLTPTSTASSSNQLAVWLAVIGVVIIVAAGIMFFRSRNPRAVPAGRSPEEAQRFDQLLDELAALDDELEAGTISEEEYRTVRDRTKAELKELMGRENDAGGD
jgi:hypothetical protein